MCHQYIYPGMYENLTAFVYKDVPSSEVCGTAYKVRRRRRRSGGGGSRSSTWWEEEE